MANQVINTGSGGLYLDAYLTNFQLGIVQSPDAYIADFVAPKIQVPKRTGQYKQWTFAEDYRLDTISRRRRGTRSTLIDAGGTNATFTCDTYGKAVFVDDQEVEDGGDEIDIKFRQTARLADHMLKLREYRTGIMATTTANFGSNTGNVTSISYNWDDYITNNNDQVYNASTNSTGYRSNPFGDIRNAQLAVLKAIGVMPNRIVLPLELAVIFRDHPQFLRRFTSWTGTIESWALSNTLFDMKVGIAKGYYNTANRNTTGTMTLASIWGNNVVLFYDQDSQVVSRGPEQIRTFVSFDLTKERVVYSWYDPAVHGTYVDSQETITENVVAGSTGYLLYNVLGSP